MVIIVFIVAVIIGFKIGRKARNSYHIKHCTDWIKNLPKEES